MNIRLSKQLYAAIKARPRSMQTWCRIAIARTWSGVVNRKHALISTPVSSRSVPMDVPEGMGAAEVRARLIEALEASPDDTAPIKAEKCVGILTNEQRLEISRKIAN